jgi:mannose-6-phosphate isomerase-like protein (cupin superfamily)
MTALKPRLIQIKDLAKANDDFRKVLFTAERSQLVIMSLRAGETIGSEVHAVDQVIYVVKGDGVAVIGEANVPFEKGAVICVPAGARHDIVNTGDEPLKLFTVYAPPQHAPGTVHPTKADAEAAEKQELATA